MECVRIGFVSCSFRQIANVWEVFFIKIFSLVNKAKYNIKM